MWNDVGPEYYRDCTIHYLREIRGYTAYVRWPRSMRPNGDMMRVDTNTEDIDISREITTKFIDVALLDLTAFAERFIATAEGKA